MTDIDQIRDRTESDFIIAPESIVPGLAQDLMQARLDRQALLAELDRLVAARCDPARHRPHPERHQEEHMTEQTDPRLERAAEWIYQTQQVTSRAFMPYVRKDAEKMLAVIDGPEPDWADVREAARKNGWTVKPDRTEARPINLWGRYGPRWMFVDMEYGWARVDRGRHGFVVDLAGPGMGHKRTVHLVDPSPAEVLAAAKLVGLTGSES